MLFASLSSRRRFKSFSDNVSNLDLDSAMTKLIKLLVSVVGDVTSACIRLVGMHNTRIEFSKDFFQKDYCSVHEDGRRDLT